MSAPEYDDYDPTAEPEDPQTAPDRDSGTALAMTRAEAAAKVDQIQERHERQPAPAPQPPPLKYTRLDDFVAGVISRRYRREVTESRQRHWCQQWWRHAEAISRLEALWRAWEHLRLDAATGSSSWWLEHADPQMDRLFDPEGTFKWCSVRGGHKQLPPLPIEPPPAAMFAGHAGGGFTTESGQ